MRILFVVLVTLVVSACTTSPPRNPGDICSIFREKDDWYGDAKDASDKWKSPIPIMMAIMYQESRFVANAKPPKKYWLGFIPAGRMSDAYGYAQAKDGTWKWYVDKSGNLYMAYHEGHGGFKKRSFDGKPWLKRVAGKVSSRAATYGTQLSRCEKDLKRGGWFFGIF